MRSAGRSSRVVSTSEERTQVRTTPQTVEFLILTIAAVIHMLWTLTAAPTGWAKKRGHRLMTIILSNLNRFKKNLIKRFLGKFAIKRILKILLHLAYVAKLPCETLMSAEQAINNKLQGSVDSAFYPTRYSKRLWAEWWTFFTFLVFADFLYSYVSTHPPAKQLFLCWTWIVLSAKIPNAFLCAIYWCCWLLTVGCPMPVT